MLLFVFDVVDVDVTCAGRLLNTVHRKKIKVGVI